VSVEIDLTGKVALITGAGSGIGRQTAQLMAQAGADVVVADINGPAADETVALVEKEGRRGLAQLVDVRDPEAAADAVATTLQQWGRVDVLVNNAAHWTTKRFSDLVYDDYVKDVHITLLGTMIMTRAVYDAMREQQSGAVVNMISDSGRTGEQFLVAYGAAKAGVMGFTKGFAKEAGRYGIRCNAVSPGTTNTPGAAGMIEQWGGQEKLLKAYPLRRLGEPIDQANAILFLASDRAAWITGQILSVSGGYTMAD
jgi:NAD(P)-dependent dehydrogenase (short-subunit alcohol dehydrogenase family)